MKTCPYRTGKYVSLRPPRPPQCFPTYPPFDFPQCGCNDIPKCDCINFSLPRSAVFFLAGYLFSSSINRDCDF